MLAIFGQRSRKEAASLVYLLNYKVRRTGKHSRATESTSLKLGNYSVKQETCQVDIERGGWWAGWRWSRSKDWRGNRPGLFFFTLRGNL